MVIEASPSHPSEDVAKRLTLPRRILIARHHGGERRRLELRLQHERDVQMAGSSSGSRNPGDVGVRYVLLEASHCVRRTDLIDRYSNDRKKVSHSDSHYAVE
ncbi:hypothetical protein PUN28_009278 [Cardiocondyla obscurior]|uniref:Uncharacterized protein n=1 Tax=Cardiocondyla obscurior TaxID=286306 RepID=A0AAW2FUL4_9HYME